MTVAVFNPLEQLLSGLQSHDAARALSALAPAARVVVHAGRAGAQEESAEDFLRAVLHGNEALVIRCERTFLAGGCGVALLVLDGLQSFPPPAALTPLGTWSRQAWVAAVADGRITRLELYWSEEQLLERGVIWRHSSAAAAA